MLLRYGQAIKLLKPIELNICSQWHNVIAQWKTKYKVETKTENHKDTWGGATHSWTSQTTKISIPVGTLGLLTYVHVDGSYEYYHISVPNPVTHRVGGGGRSEILTADYFTLQITPEEMQSLRLAQGKFLFQKEKDSNIAAMKKLEEMQKFDISQI